MAGRARMAGGLSLAVLLAGCGGGGGDGGGPAAGGIQSGSDGSGTQTGDVTLDGDLYIHGVHYHQDYYHHSFAPNEISFYFDVFNSSSRWINNVPWQITRFDTGAVVASGTFSLGAHYIAGSDGKHGTGHDIAATIHDDVGTHQYLLTIDPDNHVHETKETNNTYLYELTIPTDPGQHVPQNDLHYYAKEAHFHADEPGEGNLDFHFVAQNTFGRDLTGIPWRVRCPAANIDKTIVYNGTVAAGGTFETNTEVTVQPGEYDFEMTLDPDNIFGESDPSDNTRLFHVIVMPPASG